VSADQKDLKFVGIPLRALLITIVNKKEKDIKLYKLATAAVVNHNLFPKACKISGRFGKTSEFVRDIIKLLVQ
jgi:hypothetical protein